VPGGDHQRDREDDRIYEVLDTPSAVLDRPGVTPMTEITGRLRLEGVGFRYPGADRCEKKNLFIK